MGEIDDLYKQEAEDIDTNFLEELKTSKDHNKSFLKYRKSLENARLKFEKKYGKFNARETRRIKKMKKKIEGNPKFKHLEITHFDFKHGVWSKFVMWIDVAWFNFVRKIKRLFVWIFPDWLIYDFFTARNFVKSTWRDFMEYLDEKWQDLKGFSIRNGLSIWGKMKKVWTLIKKLSGKVLFWRKAKAPEVDKDGKEIVKEGGEKPKEEEKPEES